MSCAGGPCRCGNRSFKPADQVARFVQAEGGLGEVSHARRVRKLQPVDILQGFHQVAAVRHFAQRADHLIVVLVPDEHDAVAVAREPHRLQVHLGDQRAGGVDHIQPPLLGLPSHRWRHAVRAEDGPRPLGHFVQLLDEDGAGLPQFIHNVLVVHDFLAHIDRRPVQIQSDLHHVDSPDDAGAEAPRLEQKDLLVGAVIGRKKLKRHKDDWRRL